MSRSSIRFAVPVFATALLAVPALAEPAADTNAFNPQQIELWLAEMHPAPEPPAAAEASTSETVLLSFSDGKSSVETAVPAFKSAGESSVDRWWNQQAAESTSSTPGNSPGLAAAQSGALQRVAQSETRVDSRMQNLQTFAMQSSADRSAFFSAQNTSAAETASALRANPGNASFATSVGNAGGSSLGSGTPVVSDFAAITASSVEVAGVQLNLGPICSGSSSSSSCSSSSTGGVTNSSSFGSFSSSAVGGVTLLAPSASD
ncbi:MAG: hypothetical protein AAGA25_15570 [Planctomycetota bacterium]